MRLPCPCRRPSVWGFPCKIRWVVSGESVCARPLSSCHLGTMIVLPRAHDSVSVLMRFVIVGVSVSFQFDAIRASASSSFCFVKVQYVTEALYIVM